MSTSFTLTREQIRDAVLRKCKVLGQGKPASAADAAIVYEALDLRIKELHKQGKLWDKVSSTATNVALTANVSTAAVPTAMLFPVTMKIRVTSDDYPVDIVGHQEFQDIPDKTSTGQPEKVVVSGSSFIFWPVPDQNYTAKLTYQRIGNDSAAATAPDVPVSMLRALKIIVAYDVADDFYVDEPTILRWKVEKDAALMDIQRLNQERVDDTRVEFVDY